MPTLGSFAKGSLCGVSPSCIITADGSGCSKAALSSFSCSTVSSTLRGLPGRAPCIVLERAAWLLLAVAVVLGGGCPA